MELGIHLTEPLDPAVLDSLADFVCGDISSKYPTYRSSFFLTQFFASAGIESRHDGSTRKWWVLSVLEQLEPTDVEKVILRLMDLREYKGDREKHKLAVQSMNEILRTENFAIRFDVSRPYLIAVEPLDLSDPDLFSAASREEAEFLNKEYGSEIELADLGLDPDLTTYLQNRIEEVKACPKGKVPLGTIFLLGSTLEGLLLAVAMSDPKRFMSSVVAPKSQDGKTKQLHDWKLGELIDVACDLNAIGLDVKKYSHALRDFRNFIHPQEQMKHAFRPDEHTVAISWQVFRAAFSQLKSFAGS